MLVGRWLVWGMLATSLGCSSTDDADANASAVILHACSPLEPVTSNLKLDAGSILAAGRSADGTVYVVTQTDSKLQLFVSGADGEGVAERPAAGTGEVHESDSATWLFDYADADGTAVSVQVVQDSAGLRMGVLKGPKSSKTWDLDLGELLISLPASEAAALPATSTQNFSVDYQGTRSDGRVIVVMAPDHFANYDEFRLFWGPLSDLRQYAIVSFNRGHSLGGASAVRFETESGSATLAYSFSYPIPQTGGMSQGSLELAGQTDSLSGAAPPTMPDGAQFWCR